MELVQRIENARLLLRSGRLANESSVSTSIVFPILKALGWDVFDPMTVAPEFKVENRRVDFALLLHGRPAVFVEVKQPGRGVGADRQLFEYAFHEGVPLAVLTDGATWHLYLPAMQGNYDERRVYLLDLLEREPSESAERLIRYLDHGAVVSGEAFERAQQDYKRSRQRREAREAIPAAWEALIAEGDARLVDALAAEIERRSGYRPEPEDVFGFLAGLSASTASAPRPIPGGRGSTQPSPGPVVNEPPAKVSPSSPTTTVSPRSTLPDGTQLRATYKGQRVMAQVQGGQVVYDGQRYRSPSGAASAVTGTSVNGWIFWEGQLPGESRWVLIDALRK